MFCDKCDRIIQTGETYYALTLSKESVVDGTVHTEHAQMIKCICSGCYVSGVEIRLPVPSENM